MPEGKSVQRLAASQELFLQKINNLFTEERGAVEARLKQCCELLREYSEKYTGVYIYVVDGNNLVLKAFSGRETEHKVIPISRGICGLAATQKQTVNLPDVNQNKEYIACATQTRSELVVPVFKDGKVVAEVDIDSDFRNAFTSADEKFIQEVALCLSKLFLNYGQKRK